MNGGAQGSPSCRLGGLVAGGGGGGPSGGSRQRPCSGPGVLAAGQPCRGSAEVWPPGASGWRGARRGEDALPPGARLSRTSTAQALTPKQLLLQPFRPPVHRRRHLRLPPPSPPRAPAPAGAPAGATRGRVNREVLLDPRAGLPDPRREHSAGREVTALLPPTALRGARTSAAGALPRLPGEGGDAAACGLPPGLCVLSS